MSASRTALTEFIRQELMHGKSVSLHDDLDLFEAGIFDSLGILRMVAYIEQQFGVTVPDEDVVYENFQTVDALARYVAEHTKTSA